MFNKISLKLKVLTYIFSLTLFFILLFFVDKNNTFYYVETSNGNIESKLNTSYMYKKYCNSNNIGVCNMINNNYFYSSYYGECIAVKENNIEKCNLLLDEEKRKFCKNNFIVHDAIISGDIKKCDLLGETYHGIYDSNGNAIMSDKYNELGHNKKKNKDLCVQLFTLSKTKNIDLIEKFVLNFFGEERFGPRVFGLVLQDEKYCFEGTGIDDRIKCLLYIEKLSCNKLEDREYIYELINNTNHFYDNGKDGL